MKLNTELMLTMSILKQACSVSSAEAASAPQVINILIHLRHLRYFIGEEKPLRHTQAKTLNIKCDPDV